jgi:small subunit ribosomal protein S10e
MKKSSRPATRPFAGAGDRPPRREDGPRGYDREGYRGAAPGGGGFGRGNDKGGAPGAYQPRFGGGGGEGGGFGRGRA